MKKIIYILAFIPFALTAQNCDVETTDNSGYLLDKTSFEQIVTRLCDVESDADTDNQNELQTMSINGDVITLSDGGGSVTITHPTEPCPTFTNLANPVITYTFTSDSSQGLEQILETDRYVVESLTCVKKDVHEFQYRIRVQQGVVNGWNIIRLPNVAGYDRRVFDVGTYRQTGNVNEDNGATGAMPDAPYFGGEAAEWSNTGLVYLNQFHLKEIAAIIFVEFIVQYKAN